MANASTFPTDKDLSCRLELLVQTDGPPGSIQVQGKITIIVTIVAYLNAACLNDQVQQDYGQMAGKYFVEFLGAGYNGISAW